MAEEDEIAARNLEIRTALDAVAEHAPEAMLESVTGISHTGRSLKELLGAGSEAILPSDDREMKPERLAAALLMWGRRRLRRQQTRSALVNWARQVSAVTRRLRQRMASLPQPKAPLPVAEQRLVIFQGTTRLRFRVRNFLWAHGSPEDRLFDLMYPSVTSDKELMAARRGASRTAGERCIFNYATLGAVYSERTTTVQAMLQARRKQPATLVNEKADRSTDAFVLKQPIKPDGAAIALGPPPPPIKAVRGGVRNQEKEGRSGLHPRTDGLRTLAHLMDLRVKCRNVVMAMGASGDDDAAAEEEPVGFSDTIHGKRWERCGEIGDPLQLAWGYAVSERLFGTWRRIGLSKDGVPYKFPSSAALERVGLEELRLPGCWCPPRPRSAARGPSRAELRSYLGLLLQQKRIHVDELVGGYNHWAAKAGLEPPAEGSLPPVEAPEPLLKQHAKLALKALKYEKRANDRWETLIEKQLAPEADDECDALAVAAELRLASKRIHAFEDHLIEGLAEYSDARGALRMHAFNQGADKDLRTQLANRLAGTAFGELLGQRFEQLEIRDFTPLQIGAASLVPLKGPPMPAAAPLPFVVPAAEAAEELAIDNKILARWIGMVPALLRNATGAAVGAVVGDPDAYDEVLFGMLQTMAAAPSTQLMLTFAAIGRYAWAAARKGKDSVGKAEQVPASPPPPPGGKPLTMLTPKQIKAIKEHMLPLKARIAASTPKGAKPDEPPTLSALKEELGTLENDALVLKDPTDGDIDQMKACVQALLDLLQGATRTLRHRALAAQPPPDGAEAVAEAAATEEAARAQTARAIRKLKTSIMDALVMSLDVKQADALGDPANLISTVGEAVCDVSVGQSDLIRGAYKLLFRSTIDSVIQSPKIPAGAPRQFIIRLVKRKPVVQTTEAAAVEWATRTNAQGDVVGECAAARTWAKKCVKLLEESRDGQRALLEWITLLTLDEVRAVQGALSEPPPGESKVNLTDLVSAGVGGVAKQVLLNKLDKAMVPDSDDPLRLNKCFFLVRDAPPPPAGQPRAPKYGLPLRYAEGEEFVRGAAGAVLQGPDAPTWPQRLLDAGQRLAPDGSQFNVVRLHRIFAMQSSAADRAGTRTVERMCDEFVTLTLRNAFFEKTSDDEVVLRGKGEVLRYLQNDGFAQLKAGGPKGKQKEEGCQFVQPCLLTADGQSRCVFGTGTRETCGSVKDRFRMGEQIQWSPWGTVLGIVRVEKPLTTHYEWATMFVMENFAGVRKLLAADCNYYMLLHQFAPENAQSKRFAATKFEGSEAVFKRLENEMSRQVGNIAVCSPTFAGEKLQDLRARRKLALGASNAEIAVGEANPDSLDVNASVATAKEAYQLCLTYGGDGDGPKRSVLHFAGRWLPLGEGSARKGQLVVCVRETIGWKYDSKPPKKGEDEKPSASRSIGFLCREFFIGKRLRQPQPLAHGLEAQWELHKMRGEPKSV